jgi:hypothetical protein
VFTNPKSSDAPDGSDYLNWGFKLLFHGKKNKVQLMVTDENSAQSDYARETGSYDPLSPTARVLRLFHNVCPDLQMSRITPRKNFEEFIIKEMYPLTPASP